MYLELLFSEKCLLCFYIYFINATFINLQHYTALIAYRVSWLNDFKTVTIITIFADIQILCKFWFLLKVKYICTASVPEKWQSTVIMLTGLMHSTVLCNGYSRPSEVASQNDKSRSDFKWRKTNITYIIGETRNILHVLNWILFGL